MTAGQKSTMEQKTSTQFTSHQTGNIASST